MRVKACGTEATFLFGISAHSEQHLIELTSNTEHGKHQKPGTVDMKQEFKDEEEVQELEDMLKHIITKEMKTTKDQLDKDKEERADS